MSLSDLAGPPKAFLKALRAGDVIGIAAALDDEAVLTAEGREYRGEQNLTWLRREISLWSGAAVSIEETKRNGEVVLPL